MEMIGKPLPAADPNAPGPIAFANPTRTTGLLEGAGWRDVAMEKWDGIVRLGLTPQETASFMAGMTVKRMVAEHGLNAEKAIARIATNLEPLNTPRGLEAPAACWIVTARA
jgi:hypothetical protein